MDGSQLLQVPLRLVWQGWDTDTYSLRQSGWTLRAEQNMSPFRDEMTYRIVATSPEKALAMCAELAINGRDRAFFRGTELAGWLHAQRLPVIAVKQSDRVIRHMKPNWLASSDSLTEFNGFASVPYEEINVRDLKIFRNDEDAKNVYAPSGLITECLDRILSVQFNGDLSKIDAPKVTARLYGV